MKKKSFFIISILLMFMLFTVSYAAEEETIKKIVSIVYDDSGSMISFNNYCYSDYALQILTASLGKDDELNIVKMSDYYRNNEIGLTNQKERQKYIDEIRGYSHVGGTPFDSVNTAKNWLIRKSETYKEEADYWLVVITDGAFFDLPMDIDNYLQDLNNSFNNLNYEFVLLSIGTSYDTTLQDAVEVSANSTNVTAQDKQSVYESILEISNMINNGASDKIAKAEQIGEKTVRINSKYPLRKMMLLLQNTDNRVISITRSGSKLDAETYDVSYPLEDLKGSLTHVVDPKEEYLNSGYYEVSFAKEIDMNKLTVLCEAYVECKISIVDENDRVLNDAQMNFLTPSKIVRVKCELYNAVDGKPLEYNDETANVKVELINEKNKYPLTFDKSKNAYYGSLTLLEEKNNIYAIAESEDLFRIKSNVIFVDTLNASANIEKNENDMLKIEVPYSSDKEYKQVHQFIFSVVENMDYNVAQDFELQLLNVPDGIEFEYDGKRYGNNDKIPMIKEFGKNYILNIYSNKDYKEKEEKRVTLKILTDEYNQTIYWTSNGVDEEFLLIVPKLYPIQLIKKNIGNEIDVQEETLEFKIARTADESNILSIVNYINIEDIKSIKDNSTITSGFPYTVEQDEEDNILRLKFKPNIFALLKGNTVEVEIEVELNNSLEKTTYSEEFTLTNIDVIGILTPYIILAIILILLMGYVFKKKFNKKSQITITENGESISYALKPNLVTVLVPYMAHKTKIGMIEFKAGKNSELIYSAKNLDILKIDGEPLEEYKESHKVNIQKMIMKKDFSSININAFDVEQKYEYLTKEVDMASGDDSYLDDYSDNYSSDSDYTAGGDMDDYQF